MTTTSDPTMAEILDDKGCEPELSPDGWTIGLPARDEFVELTPDEARGMAQYLMAIAEEIDPTEETT
jgi:hypothetical protein